MTLQRPRARQAQWDAFASSEAAKNTTDLVSHSATRSPSATTTATIPSNPNGGHGRFAAGQARNASAQNEREICLRVSGLPFSWLTKDCFDFFAKFGNVTNIFIFQNQDGSSRGEAKVTFNPLPKDPFYSRRIEISTPSGGKIRVLRFQVIDNSAYSRQGDRIQVRAKRMSCGVMQDQAMLEMFTSQEYPLSDKKHPAIRFSPIMLMVAPEYHEFSLNFPVHHMVTNAASPLNRTDVYRVTFTLRQRLQVLYSIHPQNHDLVVLAFNSEIVPKCYRKGEEDSFFQERPFSWNERDSYYRQTDILLDPRATASFRRPASLRRDDSVINIGRWTAYSLVIDMKQDRGREGQALNDLLETFRKYNVDVQEASKLKLVSSREVSTVWSLIDPPPVQEGHSSLSEMLAGQLPVSFQVRYQLEVCISGGWLNEYSLTPDWVDQLRNMKPLQACALLESVATDRPEQKSRRILDPFSIFKWQVPKQSVLTQKCPDGKVIIRSATITPTTIIFNSPSIEISNRVIRAFDRHTDRFLRIRFLDERTMGRIYGRSGSRNDNEVYTRIKRVLDNGIEVGDRLYDLLAWGNSQFRENGAYFFSKTAEVNSDVIREWMGEFSEIKVVAKYAARIGQCFSTTRDVKDIKPRIFRIPDIERNGFNFTDGVGKISSIIAGMAGQDFRQFRRAQDVPSAYQFRLGGAKGVLTVWPDMKGLDICLRPSQDKFKAITEKLEIIRHSQATAFSLNRQLIMVLSALGIPHHIFVDKAAQQLDLIHRSMTEPDVARQALRLSIDANHTTPMMADMVVAGFQSSKEPFLMTLLNLWRAWSIKYLKEKARIHVSQGVVVIGVTDEAEVLRGHFDADQHFLKSRDTQERLKAVPEVFLQVSDFEGSGKSRVLIGPMILARNPSSHAGDIRVVKGVDNQKLQHLMDVVVLPQTGDRDVAGMCSGGDLDGDDFLVCWDSELIPPEWNVPAMDFAPPKPVTKEKVTLNDLTSFYVRYMKNTELGQIAHHHLAHADKWVDGVKDKRCIRLAKLHSDAVDYPKTGVEAIIDNDLKVKKWPHFMEKKNSYTSTSALGKLYDSVRREGFEPSYDDPFDKRILDAYPTSEEQEQAAENIKALYDAALRRLMQQHGIRTEFEVWSTFVMDYNSTMSDYKFAEALGQDVSAIKDQYVSICVEKAGGSDYADIAPFIVAMYKVTQRQMADALYECDTVRHDQDGNPMAMRNKSPTSMPFISFPWLFSHVMCKIAREYQALRQGVSVSGLAVLTLGDNGASSRASGGPRQQADRVEPTRLEPVIASAPAPASTPTPLQMNGTHVKTDQSDQSKTQPAARVEYSSGIDHEFDNGEVDEEDDDKDENEDEDDDSVKSQGDPSALDRLDDMFD